MPSFSNLKRVLIIDAKKGLRKPYTYLPASVEICHLTDFNRSIAYFYDPLPDLMIASSQFPLQEILTMVDLFHSFRDKEVPVIINEQSALKDKTSLPAVFHQLKMGVIHEQNTKQEVETCLSQFFA